MSRVLLLSDEEARGLLWCAKSGGHTVFVAGDAARNRALSVSPKCDGFFGLPPELSFAEASPELAEEVLRVVLRENIEVVVPSSFESLKFLVLHRARFEQVTRLVPLSDLSIIETLDDKFKFYEFCVEHGLPHPRSLLLASAEDLESGQIESLEFPLLSKPLLGAGEKGIEKFESLSALRSRVKNAEPGFFPVLIQEWFEGEDIDFNGYALHGKVAVWSVMKTTYFGPSAEPVRLTQFVRNERVEALGRQIVERAGFTGPLNVDMRIRKSDGQVLLIEVNPRFWHRSVTSLIDGLNFVDAAIRLSTDPAWRASSKCEEVEWASSIGLLLRSAILQRNKEAWQHLSRLSGVQLRYQLHDKAVNLLARARATLRPA
ncbi:MAG: ATP-grasp domain-containing protein [Polyangiaceae bacterium]|nr:ATP-grasp domain-containing protein [Polyangiaceae bacterium]